MKTNRRDFLKLSAAASVAPMLWLPKRAYAATPGFGAAEHVLVLYAKGGFRSHCTFNAVGEFPHINPFGVHAQAVAGRQWTLGAAVGSDTVQASIGGANVVIPSFASISGDVTVLGCVDHAPTGVADTDHRTAANRIGTGLPDGVTGLLSLIGKDHPLYANGFSLNAVPPVEVQPTEWGGGGGTYAQTRPLTVFGGGQTFAADQPIGQGWKMQARAALDTRFKSARSRAYRPRLDNFLVSKANAAIFADMLKDPRLAVLAEPTGADAGFTNAELLAVLGNYDLMSIGDSQSLPSWGPDVATALRFFGFGSPISVVTHDIYDMHDDEELNYAARTKDLARQLAGLHYLLHAMPHPTGGTYWDKTIVLTVSEFSRNNTGADGFNSGNGSDHVGQDAGPARNQAIALMGGPIAASKGKLIGATDDQIDALSPATVFSSQRLLATIVDALGISQNYFNVDPISELYL